MLENYDKEYLKKVLVRVIGTVLGILVIIYIGYQIWHKVTSFVKCEPAAPYTYTVKITGEGYVFRNETVIQSPAQGGVVPLVSAGTKVSSGSSVAGVFSSSGADVEKRLSEIDEQIALLSLSSGTENLGNRDVSKLDAETYSIITEMRRSAEQGRYSEASSHRLNLITKVNRRNAASGTGADVASQIASLKLKREEITRELGELVAEVKTPCSGWYYPDTDGYESIFTSSVIAGLTYDDFKTLLSTPAASTASDAGKTVVDPVWYFVCELSRESLASKEVGEEYTIYFPYNRGVKIQMTLDKICPGGEVGAAVFRTDKMPEGFDFSRMQSYELLENEYTGFKIPKSAVRMIDGQMGVYVLSGEVVHFRMIEPLTEYENYYIVRMDHEIKAEETQTPSEADTGQVAQSPEWSPKDPADTKSEETADDPAATSAESVAPAEKYKWLGLNENVIVSGKGLSDGRVITNMN